MDSSDDEGEATGATDSGTLPIDFGTSGSEAEDNGSSASGGRSNKSSLTERLRDWESDGGDDGAQRGTTPSPSPSLPASRGRDGATRKRKGESEETLTQLADSPVVPGETGDSEATQPQSQAVGNTERGRTLQKKGGRGGQSSDSEDDVFDDNDSAPSRAIDTVPQGPGSVEIPGGGAPSGGLLKAPNTLRSRSMVVDSDED